MATTPIQLRVSNETAAYLDKRAEQARAPGARATRASIAAAILDRAARLDLAVGTFDDVEVREAPAPLRALPPQATPPSKHSDGERLRWAMGDIPPGTLDKAAGVAKGTVRNCLAGGVPLASAGGGKLLAWVEKIEGAKNGA